MSSSQPAKKQKTVATPGSPAPSKKKPARIEYSKTSLAAELCFDSRKAFNQWLASDMVAPFWDDFLKDGYNKKPTKAKQWDHPVVYRRLRDGQSGGQCRFSAFRSGTKDYPDYIDCLAWLLFHMLRANTEHIGGAFYLKNIPEAQRVRSIWYVIMHLIWSQASSRAGVGTPFKPKSSQSQSSQLAAQQGGQEDEDTSEEEELIDATSLDPNKGRMRVTWDTMPDEVEDEDKIQATHGIKGFCRFTTQDDFYTYLSQVYQLGDIQHVIVHLIFEEELVTDWNKLLRHAHNTTDRLTTRLHTEKADIPSSLVIQPSSEATNSSLVRKAMWENMLGDVKQRGAVTFDIKVPYWQFHLLRVVASGRYDFNLMALRLNFDSTASIELGGTDIPDMTGLSTSGEVDEEDERRTRETRGDVQGLEWEMSMDRMTATLHGGDEPDEDAPSDDEEDLNPAPGSKLHEITLKEIQIYKEHVQWLHSTDYERDNHDEACKALGIPNPEIPRLDNMRPTAQLRHHQPTGIYALYQFEESVVGGAIEADEVGTGKSYTLTGLILHSLNVRSDKISVGVDPGPALPTLLLVPKGLIAQWVDVIRSMTDQLTIITYYGNAKPKNDGSVKYQGNQKFVRTDTVFSSDIEHNAGIVIISTVATWAARHGPSAQDKWMLEDYRARNPGMLTSEIRQLISDEYPDGSAAFAAFPSFPGNMEGCIGRIVVDEGHELRHQPEVYGTAIDWIKAPKRIVVSATPWRKDYREFAGIMHFVMNPQLRDGAHLKELGFPAEHCDADEPLAEVLKHFNPFEVPDTDTRAQLRYTDVALREYVFGFDRIKSAEDMRKVLRGVLIKRSYASTVDGKRIDEDLPQVQRTTISCKFNGPEQELYNGVYKTFSNKLFALDDKNVVWSTATYRQLCMVTSWIYFQFLQSYKVKEMRKFRKAKKNATHILKDIAKEQKRLNIEVMDVPPRDDTQATLIALTQGSPKLRTLLHLLSDIVVLQDEKVLVWVQFPAQMEWLRCALVDAGFSVECLYADLKTSDRESITRDFHTNPDGFKILIASYMVSSSGLNLHGHCRTCIEFDCAPDEATRIQIVGRVQRIGQLMWIRHIILMLDHSFDTRRVAVAMLRNLPGLATQLNLDLWGDGEAGQTSLGQWVLDGDVLRKADDPMIQGKSVKELEPEELLLRIQQQLSGQNIQDLVTVKQAAAGIFSELYDDE
ncbi:hypothetical protein N0V95_008792 [Ascochyta clinopodiicola]|nr:hypothetical protein N0V95_008792 [Ascochyta clinopodiicola]